jgi:hypothetical protein
MSLKLKESRAIADLADLLYGYLPGSGSANWKGHVSFRTVAEKVGVGEFWQPGSKTPMITALLERTLEYRRGRFEPLIVEIVRAGLIYRSKQGFPVKPEEIDKLNGLILELGFKFPDLWDPSFKMTLAQDGATRAKEHVQKVTTQEMLKETERSRRSKELEKLKKTFYDLHGNSNRQQVGFEFEKILNGMFNLHDLSPREPFRVVGEQIDGSFELDHEIYLLEAKWKQEPCPEADLLIFRGKIEGKSAYTRGVFVSFNGVSKDAAHAITQGKQPNFFSIDGYDITMLLEDNVDLATFFRKRQRILAEEGRIVVPFNELRF